MIRFRAEIRQFGSNGEKTGWNYIDIPAKLADQLFPGNRKSFRVRGKLDQLEVEALALVPIGAGDFILPLKKEIRKALKKEKGARLTVEFEKDSNPDPFPLPEDFKECLSDEPIALATFKKLPRSHQHYFIKWIDSAKTDQTRIKRIALAVNALSQGHHYGEMIRAQQKKNQNDPEI